MRAPQTAPPAAPAETPPAPASPPPVNLRAGERAAKGGAALRGLNDPATLAAIIVGTSLLVLVGGGFALRGVRL